MNFRSDSGRRGRVEATLELTPLIDVIFLLLIFFVMTTTPAMTAVEQLDIDLPDAESGAAADASDALRVVLRVEPDGDIYIREGDDAEERPVTDPAEAMGQIFEQNPGAAIWIQGDVDASHGAVIELLDVTRTVGFERVQMAVRPGD